MPQRRRKVSNLLALALLALLHPGVPMHPYEMARLLRRTGKERDMRIKWGSLYTVVNNLDKHGFIEAVGVDREGRRPERTEYRITDAGRAELKDWLRELVADPEPEFPRFEAALSVIGVMGPDETMSLLRRRLARLTELNAADGAMLAAESRLPRVFLIEAEYALAMRRAEADWIAGVLAELEAGTLSGTAEWREHHENGTLPPEWKELLDDPEN